MGPPTSKTFYLVGYKKSVIFFDLYDARLSDRLSDAVGVSDIGQKESDRHRCT